MTAWPAFGGYGRVGTESPYPATLALAEQRGQPAHNPAHRAVPGGLGPAPVTRVAVPETVALRVEETGPGFDVWSVAGERIGEHVRSSAFDSVSLAAVNKIE